MKLAVSGKGGSGKTTISGTLARVLAADGHDVVAIDDDDNPNLSLTVGIPADQRVDPLPEGLLERVESADGGVQWKLQKTPEEIVADHGHDAPGGVRLLKLGEVDQAAAGCFCSAHATGGMILEGLAGRDGGITIMDMVAGVEHLSRGTAEDVDRMLVVVEPYFKSLETGARTRKLAADLGIPRVDAVANKVRDGHDRETVERFCKDRGLELAGVVPYDDEVRRADQEGQAPFDRAPDGPAVQAIRDLARDLVDRP